MTNEEMLALHEKRFMSAVSYEKADKTCTPLLASAVAMARFADESIKPGDFYHDPARAIEMQVAGMKKFDADTDDITFCPLGANVNANASRTMVPGRDVPDDHQAEVVENNIMKPEDYDFILDNGWQEYIDKFIAPHYTEQDRKDLEKSGEIYEIYAEKLKAYPVYSMISDMYLFDGGSYDISMLRGFSNFLKDIRKMPEKVRDVMKIVNDWEISNAEARYSEAPFRISYPNIVRTDNNALSKERFQKVIWTEMEQFVNWAEDRKMITMVHIDGNYADDIDLFCELYKPKRTILQMDGFTDPFAIANDMTKHELCLWGDVPPAKMSLGTYKEVYDHCMKLKEAYGPGLMLAAGCCYPINAKIECIHAIKDAAEA